MASYYYNRYYNSDGTVKTPPPSASNLGTQVVPIKATITTTHLGTAANRVYLAPIPSTGPRTLLGLSISATDMDSNGTPTLDADLVLIYTINGVEQTAIVIVDTSALSIPLSAAVTWQWIDLMQAIPNADAGGPVHLVLLINTAAATAAQGTLTIKAEYV
jgi:hypothetical protein